MSRFPNVPYRPAPFRTSTPYVRATTDSRGPRPGAIGFLAWYLEQAPHVARCLGLDPARVNARSMGIYNYRPTASGNLSVHAEGRAVDIGHNVSREAHLVMTFLLAALAPHAAGLGIQYVIFSRAQTTAAGPWRDYGPVPPMSPHDDHAHVELTPTAAAVGAATYTATLRSRVGDWRTQEDDMSAAVEGIQRTLNAAGFTDEDGAVLTVDGSWGPKTEAAFATQSRAAARHLTAVQDVQTSLNGAGFRDSRGRTLTVDGWWGQRTAEAYAASLTPGLTQAQADRRYLQPGPVTLTPSS